MTTTDSRPDASQGSRLSRRDRSVITTLLVATFVVILNETIMSVALPRLMLDLGIDAKDRSVAVHRLHADDGRGHPDHRLPAPAADHADGVPAGHGPLHGRHGCSPRIAPGFWVLLPARIVQASGTAMMLPLLMTTDPHPGADRTPRCGDGQHQHRHLGRPGHRADRVRGSSCSSCRGGSCSSPCCRSRWPP